MLTELQIIASYISHTWCGKRETWQPIAEYFSFSREPVELNL